MTIEAWAALAQIGTFVVIAATAVAALIQLKHLRAANDMAASNLFIQEYEGPDLRDAFAFVRTRLAESLEDPSFRQELRDGHLDRRRHPEIAVCNFFDQWGGYYRSGAINRTMFMRHNADLIVWFWKTLEPVVALSTRGGANTAFEQFEYLVVVTTDWLERHPRGDYPPGVRRLPLLDRWREADAKRR